jgi:hypothetical protein
METLGLKTFNQVFPIDIDEESMDEITTLLECGENISEEILDEAINSLDENEQDYLLME